MSLDRFIFCSCNHALEVHGNDGCSACRCRSVQKEVIDAVLDREREAIRRTWLNPGAASSVTRNAG